jgi:uncharacterized membrane protein
MWTRQRTARLVWAAVILLAIIGLAAVTRRVLDLAQVIPPTSLSTRGGVFDAGFALHPILTLTHILPGALFMVLGPMQFVRGIRSRHLRLHRLLGRVYVAASVVIGLSALVLAFTVTIGGPVETAATLVFAPLVLFALTKAVVHVRRHEIALHREWMIRAFAIGLAVATVRPIVGLFFGLTTLLPQQFFGYAFWIGFLLHVTVAEVWIRATRTRPSYDLGSAPAESVPVSRSIQIPQTLPAAGCQSGHVTTSWPFAASPVIASRPIRSSTLSRFGLYGCGSAVIGKL